MHFVRHTDMSAVFGVTVFGSDQFGMECSYGMPGAADFTGIDVSTCALSFKDIGT